MAGDAEDARPRYWAFISYSHKDAAFGRRLHRRLETYSLPRRLVGRETRQGVVSRRLAPIFRDREELPAAADLSAEVRAALAQSKSLVVVCSPDAAASKWVSREVDLFRALHPGGPIFAAICDGDPPQCFPEALFDTGPAEEPIEPLAADFRPRRDGAHLGLLKLVAGIAGLGLDELVQRDAQRNVRRVTAVTAAALAAVLLMGALTATALKARKEAERQRGEAEGLVEFMLTDLRDRLKGVGRLDVMTAVNQRALHYYEDQDLASLPVDSLERRARILHAMGEDDIAREDDAAALSKFREADRTTVALLRDAPNDPERIFDQAQSEFWIGYISYVLGHYQDAKRQFQAYKHLADRMVSISPNSSRYLRELAFAEGNLCSLALKPPEDRKGALDLCSSALAHMQRASHEHNPVYDIMADIANRHAWLADAYLANHDSAKALQHRLAQDAILHSLMDRDPNNFDLRDDWISLQRVLARMEGASGNLEQAKAMLVGASKVLDSIIAFDPNNKTWLEMRDKLHNDLSMIAQEGEVDEQNGTKSTNVSSRYTIAHTRGSLGSNCAVRCSKIRSQH